MPGFEFGINLTITYATLRDLARDQLLGREVEVRDGVIIRIDDLDLRPRDDRVEVTVRFAVTRMMKLPLKPEGQVVLLGDPAYDPDTRHLSIQRLELAVETEHKVLKAADKLLHRTLEKRLEKALDFSLEEHLDRLGENLGDVPIGDLGHIRLEFTRLEPRRIEADTDGIEVAIDVVGRGTIDLDLGRRVNQREAREDARPAGGP
jgi:hypothetical protein